MNPWDILTWAVAIALSVTAAALAVVVVGEVVRTIRKNNKEQK